jgi:hypothetical protein
MIIKELEILDFVIITNLCSPKRSFREGKDVGFKKKDFLKYGYR